jgi:DNA-binding winged helix-turn-helix (wHTH) protein/tetratricopeptide (TPR) repeat protein
MRFTLNDIELNLIAGLVVKDGQTINIRAKTLSVLKYLIEHQDKVVSKQEILATVWHDVVVQEQVLVQSIKEIRDLLGSHVIKTYPRQGYQWTAELAEVPAKKMLPAKFSKTALVITFTLLIFIPVITGLVYYFTTSNSAEVQVDKFTVSFLPVINDMPDDIHDWVPLQGKDYLSETLSQNSQLTVVERPLLSIEQSDLTNIAKQLKTNLVVQTRLLGYPQDFQLHYSLHLTHSIERGIIFAQSIGGAFDQLVEAIALRFDQYTPARATIPYVSDFSNEAFARGIEHYLQRQYPQAITFFTSALQSNTNLLAARRYLAASYINSGNAEKGIALMKENIEQARLKQDHREEIRSHLMVGVLLINRYEEGQNPDKNLKEAELYINTAKTLAEQYQDALFRVYAYEELAKIKRLQQEYTQSISLLNQALKLYQAFSSDYGQTRPLIELALVASAQNQYPLALKYFSQADEIANKNGVATNKVAILLAKAKVQQSHNEADAAQQSAKQAMSIAQQASSQLLIARVEAWLAHNNLYEIN